MGGKKKYIEMIGSFTEPFICLNIMTCHYFFKDRLELGIGLALRLGLQFGFEFFFQYYFEVLHPHNITVMRKQSGTL